MLLWCLVLAALAGAQHVALVVDLSTLQPLNTTRLLDGSEATEISIFCQDRWLLTKTSVNDTRTIDMALAALSPTVVRNWHASLELVARHAPLAQTIYLITDEVPPAGTRLTPPTGARLVCMDAALQEFRALTVAPTRAPTTTTTRAPTRAPTFTSTRKSMSTGSRTKAPTFATSTRTSSTSRTRAPTFAPTTPPLVQTVKVIGHIYCKDANAPGEQESQRLATVRGYRGVPVTLRSGASVLGETLSNDMGEYVFDNVPVDTVMFSFDTPPGFELIEPKHVTLRAGGINRIPPIELTFDSRHLSKTDPLVTDGHWSTESIVVVTIVSVASFVAVLVVIFVCMRRQSVEPAKEADIIYQRIATPVQHGLKNKRV